MTVCPTGVRIPLSAFQVYGVMAACRSSKPEMLVRIQLCLFCRYKHNWYCSGLLIRSPAWPAYRFESCWRRDVLSVFRTGLFYCNLGCIEYTDICVDLVLLDLHFLEDCDIVYTKHTFMRIKLSCALKIT